MFNRFHFKSLRPFWSLAYIVLPLFSFLLIGASQDSRSARTCTKVHVILEYRSENFFLDLESVREMIGAQDLILGSPIQDIQLSQIEETILATQYVNKCNADFNADGELIVQLWLNNPIARVMNEKGNSFYVDEKGSMIPVSTQFTARTPLVRGSFIDSIPKAGLVEDSLLQAMVPVLNHLHNDSLWSANTSEVLVHPDGRWSIITQVGNMRIDMGRISEHQHQFLVLDTFVSQVLNKNGWNRYKRLRFDFHQQIVAIR